MERAPRTPALRVRLHQQEREALLLGPVRRMTLEVRAFGEDVAARAQRENARDDAGREPRATDAERDVGERAVRRRFRGRWGHDRRRLWFQHHRLVRDELTF